MAFRAVIARARPLGPYTSVRALSNVAKEGVVGDHATETSKNVPQPKQPKVAGKAKSQVKRPSYDGTQTVSEYSEKADRLRRTYGLDGGNTLPWEDFQSRHIGPRDEEIQGMLKELGPGSETLDSFVKQVIPPDVLMPPKFSIVERPWTERSFTEMFNDLTEKNTKKLRHLEGGGYYPVETPPVIRRNILENPAWYTSYTPYQAEISQGRLESLLNFQTMVSDLTGLPIANASLLDEGTAAAEAMTLSLNSLPSSRAKGTNKTFVVSHLVNSRTIKVLAGRAEGFGVNIKVVDVSSPDISESLDQLGQDLVGVLVQYPDKHGGVQDFRRLAEKVHEHGALVSAATDLSALTVLAPPGEWGADVAFGNSQRFGVPMGGGGPHAAFMSVTEALKRRLPGRLVGVSKDRTGRPALRLALQTREQHIRREKATSNVCTAQALLANMAAMYAIYHGPAQLRNMEVKNVLYARAVAALASHYGYELATSSYQAGGLPLSDTIAIKIADKKTLDRMRTDAFRRDIGIGLDSEEQIVTIACLAEHGPEIFEDLAVFFAHNAPNNASDGEPITVAADIWKRTFSSSTDAFLESIPESVRRTSTYLTHPVFNSYHSETEMLRYIHHLQSKDLSLTHAMIPLGSCTMKLNATSQMELISNKTWGNVHPFGAKASTRHAQRVGKELSAQLNRITGMNHTSLQPNSGAQGEFAGLRAIRKYHESNSGGKRDICLIPTSAHGTNPASAAMAGMRVVLVKCDSKTGNLDLADLKAKCEKHAEELAAIMITYPSTFGVFEPDIIEICKTVHDFGGQVYMDGANMNAQIGLTSPGAIGADVCHLNLHKTFCIPHGGGGPGVGPICVKSHLKPYLPHSDGQVPVASAPLGSASILPISWAYISTMGDSGLQKATTMALLNANYLLAKLKPYYEILYVNDNGRCAHEFILDVRSFKASSGIEAADIAKRLQDFGFHAPTLSFPVANTLMIEPTESESKYELDRFVEALVTIREEIRDVEEGRQPRERNVLKMSPHTQLDIVEGDGEGSWDRPYSREKAAYPVAGLKERKFWPSVSRVDDTYGDTNLYCTCPPIEDYANDV